MESKSQLEVALAQKILLLEEKLQETEDYNDSLRLAYHELRENANNTMDRVMSLHAQDRDQLCKKFAALLKEKVIQIKELEARLEAQTTSDDAMKKIEEHVTTTTK